MRENQALKLSFILTPYTDSNILTTWRNDNMILSFTCRPMHNALLEIISMHRLPFLVEAVAMQPMMMIILIKLTTDISIANLVAVGQSEHSPLVS